MSRSLSDRNIDFFVYDNIPAVTDSQTIMNALTLAKEAHIHGVIGAGGAKAINLARAISSLYNEKNDVYSFVDGEEAKTTPLPLLVAPTTVRDTFVFTQRIPVTDARSSKLRLLKTQEGLTRMIVFDPNTTTSLTENQTASMSIEVLLIAIESYISQKATFFSDMIAEKAVELLGYAQEGAPTLTITTPQEVLFSQAGCMASLASASSSIGAGTLLAQCINARFKISRSLVSVILLPYIIEDAAKFRQDRLARLSHILNVAPVDSDEAGAVQALVEYTRQRIAHSNLPARLKDLNVTIEQLALCAEDAGDLEFMQSLQRSMTSDDLFDLLKLAF